MTDSLSEFALHPLHALSAYCSEKQLMVYDNDCKYNLFKCSFVTQEEKPLSPPHSPIENPAPSTASIPSVPAESSLFCFILDFTQGAPHHQTVVSPRSARSFFPQSSYPIRSRVSRAALSRFPRASCRSHGSIGSPGSIGSACVACIACNI